MLVKDANMLLWDAFIILFGVTVVTKHTVPQHRGGAENAEVENAGVENTGAKTYGKPLEQKIKIRINW